MIGETMLGNALSYFHPHTSFSATPSEPSLPAAVALCVHTDSRCELTAGFRSLRVPVALRKLCGSDMPKLSIPCLKSLWSCFASRIFSDLRTSAHTMGYLHSLEMGPKFKHKTHGYLTFVAGRPFIQFFNYSV